MGIYRKLSAGTLASCSVRVLRHDVKWIGRVARREIRAFNDFFRQHKRDQHFQRAGRFAASIWYRPSTALACI